MVVGKKGIELSMNFVVMLIIAIVIFGFGIRFIYTLSSNANDIKDISSKELDARVADLLCSTSQKICIGTDKKIIQKGKFDIFGIRILNVGDAQDFDILIQRPSPSGFTKQKQAISNDGLLAVPNERSERFLRNEERNFGVGVEVPSSALSGTYIFDVRVQKANGEQYGSTQRLYVEVP